MPLLVANFGAQLSPYEFKSDWGWWPTQFSQDTHFFLFPSPSVLPTSQLLLVVNTKHSLVVSAKHSKPLFFFFYYYIFRRKFQTATPPRHPVNFDGSKVKTSSSNGNEGLFEPQEFIKDQKNPIDCHYNWSRKICETVQKIFLHHCCDHTHHVRATKKKKKKIGTFGQVSWGSGSFWFGHNTNAWSEMGGCSWRVFLALCWFFSLFFYISLAAVCFALNKKWQHRGVRPTLLMFTIFFGLAIQQSAAVQGVRGDWAVFAPPVKSTVKHCVTRALTERHFFLTHIVHTTETQNISACSQQSPLMICQKMWGACGQNTVSQLL